MSQICEKPCVYADHKTICCREKGHKGSCIGIVRTARDADAYERGAEAMREQMIQVVRARWGEDDVPLIRVVPVPEDKP